MMVGTDNDRDSCLNRIPSLGSPEERVILWNTNIIYQLIKLVAHSCNTSVRDAEAGGSL